MKKIIIGMTGATGVLYGIRLLEVLKAVDEAETHLVLSAWARENIRQETGYTPDEVESLADSVYSPGDLGAGIASGSFLSDGMVILPCSMKTLSAIANGYADNLISRAADVMLKERRPLIICPRETPLNEIHLENMLKLCRAGARIIPPMPAFYQKPRTIDDLINHHIMKILDQLQIPNALSKRWGD